MLHLMQKFQQPAGALRMQRNRVLDSLGLIGGQGGRIWPGDGLQRFGRGVTLLGWTAG